MSYFDDNEDRIIYGGARGGGKRFKDRGKSDRNEIVCKRCGEDGCYWYQMPSADGKSERPVLFNNEGKRHVCVDAAVADEFTPAP